MRDFTQGRIQRHLSFLRRQFRQDGGLPFSDVLSEEVVSQALTVIGTSWNDSIFTPTCHALGVPGAGSQRRPLLSCLGGSVDCRSRVAGAQAV